MLSKLKTIFISLPAKIVAGLIIFYFLFAYFAVNPLAKKLVPWVAEKQLASLASVAKVEFDPLRLKTTIEHFKLSEKSGAPLVSVDKLIVDLEADGLFDWAWKFKDISITAPSANIAISSKGKFNWADLIAKLNEDKTPPSETIPRLLIGHIEMIRGNIQYADANRATPFKAGLAPLDFELDGFSTLPKDRGDYLLAAKLANQGGTLKWKGNMGVNPVASKGSIGIDNIQVAKLLQIIKTDAMPFKATAGDVQTNFNYDFSLPKDQPKIRLSNINVALNNVAGTLLDAGNLSLKQATLTTPTLTYSSQNKPELQLQDLALKLDDISLQQGQDTLANVKQANATLPKLDIAMQNDAPILLQDLNMKLTNLSLAKGKESLLTLPELDVKQFNYNVAENQANIAQIVLPSGIVNAARDKTGNINWQQAFATENKPAKTANNATSVEETTQKQSAPFSLTIADIQLKNWKLAYQDAGFVHPLQANVADFNLGFTLATKGSNIAISKLESSSTGISAKSALSNTPVATLTKLNLKQADINLEKQKVSIQSIVLSGLKTELIKEANKPLNWQTILEPSVGTKSSTSVTSNNKPEWAVALKKLALDNANVHIEDRSLSTPVVLDVEKMMVELQDASLDLSRALPIKAAFQVKQGGSFTTQGKLTPTPLKADVDLKLAEFSFKPFAPYLNQFALLKLNDGAGNVAGKLQVKDDKTLAVTFNGGFSVDKLALVEEASDAPFLAWDKLSSDSLAFSLAPNRVHMAALNIDKAAGKFIINADKSTNIAKILRSTANTNTTSAAPSSAPVSAAESTETANKAVTEVAKEATSTEMAQAVLTGASTGTTTKVIETAPVVDTTPDTFPVTIETLRIDNAALEFADLSLTPQFGTQIHSLSGVINSVSTNPNNTAQVELDGKVDDYGSASVRGSVQPFKATNFTDLKLAFKNLEMNRLTPYSGKFAGRRIDSGKLSVDLEYKIKQRKLAGENKFVINKLKLGEKIDSKDAASLPLDLAIAILEDSDGVIDLDLPISGSLDDPKFSYGSIVWKAIRNVLGKIVTAPFRALGKLFGGGGDKLEVISFDAGSAVISPPEQEKLKSVSQALSKRPGLALGIIPSYHTATDTRAVQESTLRKQVAEELDIKITEDQQAGPIDLSNPKTQKAIDTLHDKLTKKGLLKKLVSKFEKPEAGHYEQAQEKLTASIVVTEANLQALAKSRGTAIQKTLETAGIAIDRVQIENPVGNKTSGKTVDTKLTINVKGGKSKAAEPTASEPKASETKVSEPVSPPADPAKN